MPWSWKQANKKWLTIIWVTVFILHALVYLALIPPWQAPDEPTSVELVLTIEAQHRLVNPGDEIPEIQRAIIDSMERNRFWELGGYGRPLTSNDERNFRGIWHCCASQLVSPPFYQVLLLPVAKLTKGWGIDQRLRMLRLATILLAAFTVAVVVQIGFELVAIHPAIPLLLPAFVCLSPQFAYSSATVNSDNLAALIGTLLFWRLLRVLRDGISAALIVQLALLILLGFVTKRTTLLVVPALLLALAWQAIVMVKGRDKRLGAKPLIAVSGGLATLCLLIAAVPAFRSPVKASVLLYVFKNDPLKQLTVLQQIPAQHITFWAWLTGSIKHLSLTFVGNYGWHQAHISRTVAGLVLVPVLASWACALIWLWHSQRVLPSWMMRAVWVCIFCVATAIMLTILGTPPEFFPQGRYLFPVIAPISLLTTIGICAWLPKYWSRMGVGIIVCTLLALDFYCIFAVVMPAFVR